MLEFTWDVAQPNRYPLGGMKSVLSPSFPLTMYDTSLYFFSMVHNIGRLTLGNAFLRSRSIAISFLFSLLSFISSKFETLLHRL